MGVALEGRQRSQPSLGVASEGRRVERVEPSQGVMCQRVVRERERMGPVQSQCGFWREEGGPNSVGVALEGPQRSQPSLRGVREEREIRSGGAQCSVVSARRG